MVEPNVANYFYECSIRQDRIDRKYNSYRANPNLHPKLIEEWNDFWIFNYNKLRNHMIDESTCHFMQQWKEHWPKRLSEMHAEEILEMHVKLRGNMKLPIELDDLDKLQNIIMHRKVRIKERNPTIELTINGVNRKVVIPSPPFGRLLIDLNKLADDINLSSSKPRRPVDASSSHAAPSGSFNRSVLLSTDANRQLPPEPSNVAYPKSPNTGPTIESLSNKDLIVLFSNYENLSEKLQTDLVTYMDHLEKNNPERYQELKDARLESNENFEDKVEDQVPPKQASIIIDDDNDDYPLESMIKRVHDNATITLLTDDESESKSPSVIDLSDDDSAIGLVDSTDTIM